jgi:hypothetical protein
VVTLNIAIYYFEIKAEYHLIMDFVILYWKRR